MCEGSSDPGFEAGMIVGDVTATWEPGAVEPLECTQFQVEPAADLELSGDHRGERELADFAFRGESLCAHGDIIPAVFQRGDLGVVPLIAQPLAVGEFMTLGPRDEALGGSEDAVALVRPRDADVGHAA